MNNEGLALDAESMIKLISEMDPEARQLLQAVIGDVLEHGNVLSDVQINELAKKYADKARKLAGSGGE
jgi:hypothetical protein